MTATIKANEELLLAALAAFLTPYGYERSKQDFQKTYRWGRTAFHIAFIKHNSDFDITGDIGIRSNALEALVQKSNILLTSAEKKNTFSMGAELANLKDRKQRRLRVSNEQDVSTVSTELFRHFEEIAIPYFTKYSDMEAAINVLSSNSFVAWLHSPIHAERAKRAVGLAWLLKDFQRAESLIVESEAFLSDSNDFGLSSFRSFVQLLRESESIGKIKGDEGYCG